METTVLKDNEGNDTGLGMETSEKNVEVEPSRESGGPVVTERAIETQKAVHVTQSVGETIDDIVNELKNSGVVMELDVNALSTDVLTSDASKHNGTGDHAAQKEQQAPNDVTVPAAGPKDVTVPAAGPKDDKCSSQEKVSEEKEKVAEEPLTSPRADSATGTESSEAAGQKTDQDTEEIIQDTDDSAPKEADEQSDDQQQSSRASKSADKHLSKAEGSSKRRRRILKIAVGGTSPKKLAGPKSSKRNNAAKSSKPAKGSQKEEAKETEKKNDDSSEDESLVQLVKKARVLRRLASDKTGESKASENEVRPKGKGNRGTKRKQKGKVQNSGIKKQEETASIASDDESLAEDTAKRRRTVLTEGTEEDGDVQHVPTAKTAKAVPRRGKKPPTKVVRQEEETETRSQSSVRSEQGSSVSEVSEWRLEDFVESDVYVKEVIGQSFGSTNGRFLTIELPDRDTIRRRRAWHVPRVRRSRPVVLGGCDPNAVFVDSMGVRMPISCWVPFERITPRVVVTDIFEEMVRRQSSCSSE